MQWQPTGNLKNARARHTATLLPSGLVLVSFGSYPSSAELYHPDTNEWILTTGSPSLPRPLRHFCATATCLQSAGAPASRAATPNCVPKYMIIPHKPGVSRGVIRSVL